METLVGRTIGPYKILAKIGQGGMAEVYKGFHPALGRHVAVKLMGRALRNDPAFSRRFRREAQAAASLRHPNVIRVFDFGAYEGGHYIVMEYVEGTDLHVEINRRRRANEPFSRHEILSVLAQIADALDYAHRQGVVHRDVKPANILLDAEDHVILTDFGLAMLHNRISQETTGCSFGTPEYIAPEQAIDSRAAVPQSDLYALGAILYELATGRPVFFAESPLSLALMHISKDPTPPRRHAPDLPRAVEAVILRALAKEPEKRFPTARAMVEALERAWSGRPIPSSAQEITLPGLSIGRRIPSAPPPPPPPATTQVGLPAAPTRRRRQATIAALVGLLALALTLACATLLPRLLRDGGPLTLVAGGAAATSTPTPDPTATDPPPPTPTPRPTTTRPPSPAATSTPGLTSTSPSAPLPVLLLTPSPSPTATGTATAFPSPTPTATRPPTPLPLPTLPVSPPASATPAPTDVPPTPTPFVPRSVRRPTDKMTMFFVPAGPFPMGVDLEDDPAAFPHEDPRHDVVLASFWIDETEVTNRQYERCVKADECLPPQNTTAYDDRSRADHPVVHVDWSQADAYCRWLADKTGLDVRLPTEAQWEKAASWDPATQSKRRYPWGDEEPDPALFNYVASGLGHPVAVGSYPAASGPYGTLDTAGNVWEWIADWYDQNAYDASDGAVDPTGPDEGTRRVIRGGSFSFSEHEARTTHRDAMEPTVTRADIGFRCVVAGEWLPPGWQEKGE